MPKYTRSKVENLLKVDDGSGEDKWTIDARTLPKPEELRAGPVRRNTENKGYKKVSEGVAGKVEAKYEVDPDYTDQEGKTFSFGTVEHEKRAAKRAASTFIHNTETGESHALDSEEGQTHHAAHKAFQDLGMTSPYQIGGPKPEKWDSSQYDPEKDGYASEYGYDPTHDISWENKRAKRKGEQTQYGWKAMLKESRPGGASVFSRWLATKTLGAEKGTPQTPAYWTGDTPKHGEDVVPGPQFTDADFKATSAQGKERSLGPEQYFTQAGSAEAQTLNRLTVTGDPNKKSQRLRTVNIPERADYETQQAGTQTDNVAAAQAVAKTIPAPKAPAEKRAAAKPAAKAPATATPQTGTINTPMKVVCPHCNAVSGDDPVAFHIEHQRLHAQ